MGDAQEGGMNPVDGLLGPEGVQQRMSQIQQRLDQVLGREFKSYLANTPTPLQGKIGDPKPFDPFSAGVNLTSKASPALKAMIQNAARAQGVDENLLNALVASESAYDPNARSRTGALGLCQLMPSTATALGVSNPFDPQQNVQAGAKYLGQLLRQFGNAPLALAAYNAGPNAVIKAGNTIPPYPETQAYVQRVMSLFNASSAGDR